MKILAVSVTLVLLVLLLVTFGISVSAQDPVLDKQVFLPVAGWSFVPAEIEPVPNCPAGTIPIDLDFMMKWQPLSVDSIYIKSDVDGTYCLSDIGIHYSNYYNSDGPVIVWKDTVRRPYIYQKVDGYRQDGHCGLHYFQAGDAVVGDLEKLFPITVDDAILVGDTHKYYQLTITDQMLTDAGIDGFCYHVSALKLTSDFIGNLNMGW